MSKASKAVRQFLTSIGRKGGKARLRKLTPEQRREAARRAARARWSKTRRKKSSA